MSKIRIQNAAEEDVLVFDIETGKITTSDVVDLSETAATFIRCLETALYAAKNEGASPFREMLLRGAEGENAGDFLLKPGNGHHKPRGGDVTMDPDTDPSSATIMTHEGEGDGQGGTVAFTDG